ncbi:MAG: MATE family efflux transporter [Clostridia bacterium]|nr:MATE family efflux transporter [Clostridia bacterium]
MKQTQDFTQGRIFAPLVKFALPVLLALFLQTTYGAVDLLVVGWFGTPADVSAVSTGSQIMHTITVVITGLAMGLTVLVGRKIGEGEKREAGKIIGSGFCLFAVVAVVVSVATVFLASPLSNVMHAPEQAFSQTVSYVVICGAGTVFIVAYNLVGSIFRGIGDSKMPLITVAIACGLNIVGDLVLCGGFGLGTVGAAIATVFAQAVSVFLSVLIIKKRGLPFVFRRKDIRPDRKYISRMLVLGAPIALQDLLVSISFLVITAIINEIGLIESAGLGVAQKMCGFLMLVSSSYMQSMSAFVAQNIGAQKPERARKALLCGIVSSLVVGVVIWYCTFFHGEILAGIFSKDAPVISAAADYMKAYAIDCLFTSFLFCFIGYFNGCGNTVFVMIQGLIGAFGVRVPISWIVSKYTTRLFHIGLATPASTVIQIILCGIFLTITVKKYKRSKTQI